MKILQTIMFLLCTCMAAFPLHAQEKLDLKGTACVPVRSVSEESLAFQHGEKIEHDGTTERTVLAFGNIGVTSSQDMLTQEIEIAKILNVIPVIIQSFINRFCIQVY